MKTIKNLLFVAFAAMTIAACQKEFENPEGGMKNSGKVVNFTGTMGDVHTKTTLWYEEGLDDRVFPTRFMLSDHIMVNGSESGDIVKENTPGTQISFSVKGVESPYFAVSAAHMKNTGCKYENNQYTILYSSSQKYRLVNGKTMVSHHSEADIFAAYSEDETMTFKHLTTFLAITIDKEKSTETANIKNIYVRQGDGSNIAGRWYVKYDKYDENNKIAPYLEPADLTAYISYECVVTNKSESSNFSPDGVPQGKTMIVGVPAYDYENGLLVTIEDMNGKFASFKINESDFSSHGGVIFPVNFEFKPESRRTIKTAADWNEFAAHINATAGNAYQWVGGGTIVLEENIEAESLTPITAEFKYVFDGNGKTITQTKATEPLFKKVSGEIKNLTLDGILDLGSTYGAPLVDDLMTGGRISGCTNNMSVTCSRKGNTYVAGLVCFMRSATIENCINTGDITVTVNVNKGAKDEMFNVVVAGIVSDIRVEDADKIRTVTLEQCKNTGDVTLYPELSFTAAKTSRDQGMKICGLGGIAGWVENSATYTFKDCDNEGNVTLDASKITNSKGNNPLVMAVGGVIGLAAPTKDGWIIDPTSSDYFTTYDLTITDCANTGTVNNQGHNYSSTTESKNKVFTGGLAGALMGTANSFVTVKTCENTGTLTTHDYVSGVEGITASERPAYCAVAGGLVGCGGYLDMDGVTVQCQIGNGVRQMAAWGGVIGYTFSKFNLKNSTIDVTGFYPGYTGYLGNRAVIAVIPMQHKTSAMDLQPNVAESVISGNSIKCELWTSESGASATTKNSLLETLTTNVCNTKEKVAENLVCGHGFTANTGITIGDGTTDNNTYIAGTAN